VFRHDWWQKGPYYYWWRDVTDLIPDGQGLIADVGCGTGQQKAIVESKGYTWVGLDTERRAPGSIEVSLIEDGRFPLGDSSVDHLLCRQVLEHVSRLELFAQECRRVLKPGGTMFGSHSWLECDHDNASYYNLSHDGIRHLLSRHGFDLVRIEPGIHVGVLLLHHLFDDLVASRLARLVAAAQMLSDRRRMRQKRPEDAGLSLPEIQSENALRLAGHLLWIARKL